MHAFTRRRLLGTTAAVLASALIAACRGQQATPTTATAPTVAPPVNTPASLPTAVMNVTPTPTQEAVRRGGILHFNLPGDPANLDLHQATTSTDLWCIGPCFDTLLQFDPNDQTKILPDLAIRWDISSDGLTYTFFLRQGVQFHDGSPFTSKDVLVTFQRIISPPEGVNSPRSVFFNTVERIETPDDVTVRFVLKQPDPALLYNVAIPWTGIYPAHLIEAGADLRDTKNLIGTGPFKFKSYTPGVTYELEKNPNYWNPNLPYLDGIVFYPMADPNVAAQALIAGQIHLNRGLGVPPLDLFQGHADIRVAGIPTTLVWRLVLNGRQFEPFRDPRVRQAISLAIDREAMIEVGTEGRSVLSGWMHPYGAWALPEDRVRQARGFGKDKEADRQQAKQLLAEAGFPNGFDVELLAFALGTPVTQSLVADQLGQIGIRVNVQNLQLGEYVQRVVAREFQMSLGFNAPWVDEPKSTFGAWITRNEQASLTGLWSEELIQLYERIDRELDLAKRKQLTQDLDFRSLDDPAFGMIYLFRPVIWHIYRPSVLAGFTPQPNYNLTEKHATTWLRS
jgi:peptide/nickel transport system substrate-binding protein